MATDLRREKKIFGLFGYVKKRNADTHFHGSNVETTTVKSVTTFFDFFFDLFLIEKVL
jgi:hypothetical protein